VSRSLSGDCRLSLSRGISEAVLRREQMGILKESTKKIGTIGEKIGRGGVRARGDAKKKKTT